MSGWCGSARAISRKTVRPPTPESKMPMGELAVGSWPLADDDPLPTANCQLFLRAIPYHRTAAFSFDVVLLDLLVQIRARRVDGLGGLRDVPAVLAQLGQDERLLRLVLELLQRGEAHGRGDDLGGGAEELGRQVGDVDG